jgi:hypothetical protein
LEVVLTAEGATDEIRKKVAATEPKEITRRRQEAVEKSKIKGEKPVLIFRQPLDIV